ncbi:conserved hypothetical protein [Leishmania major strain Friedlin]|uniref:Uncharacterized protein n=1 Tax=Leishmania major TaxID=5664 RepID=Q4Q9I5_LEIMA|nr:conserved hypothetical protein [Leishmania major strain Friedlin]CAG9576240.1 hypothetical_protein_-_conserved [Leishmania major strain Friedlin]CAJ04471.1 conserved hypothetical protein [Leishmania major strain Friedlin]|eukprot:XP_001684013.1 conserved hypothetical protein [Leishmania major strain Friedlin]
MIENGEDEWSGVRAQNATPSSRELLERIQYNRELSRASSLARRRVGALTPSDAEVQAVYAAREAAAAHQLEEILHGDRHRRRVVSMRYYDALMAATTDDVFQESQPLSDVEARRVVLGPLRKLVAVLATRQRFAGLLRCASGVGDALHTDRVSAQLAAHSALPPPSPLPNISTLLRGIALPDMGASRRFAGSGHGDPAFDFVEAPRSRPWHEPFAFRLKHFTPVPMPSFVLDVAAQAEREVRRSDGESPSAQEGDDVPTLLAVQPSGALTNVSLLAPCTTSGRPAKAAAHGRSPAGAAPATG